MEIQFSPIKMACPRVWQNVGQAIATKSSSTCRSLMKQTESQFLKIYFPIEESSNRSRWLSWKNDGQNSFMDSGSQSEKTTKLFFGFCSCFPLGNNYLSLTGNRDNAFIMLYTACAQSETLILDLKTHIGPLLVPNHGVCLWKSTGQLCWHKTETFHSGRKTCIGLFPALIFVPCGKMLGRVGYLCTNRDISFKT